MRKTLAVLILLGLVAFALPMTAAALGLDVEAKAGAGIGLGTTDNPDITGSPRLSAGGGVGLDFYLISLGPVDLGLSAGVEYSHSTFHYTWSNVRISGKRPGCRCNLRLPEHSHFSRMQTSRHGVHPGHSSRRRVYRLL